MGMYNPTKGRFIPLSGKYDRKGIADILGILDDGRFFCIEVKTKTGKISEDQKSFLEDIKSYGGIAFIARSVEDVVNEFRPKGGADLGD